jgi:hypothetical protein
MRFDPVTNGALQVLAPSVTRRPKCPDQAEALLMAIFQAQSSLQSSLSN